MCRVVALLSQENDSAKSRGLPIKTLEGAVVFQPAAGKGAGARAGKAGLPVAKASELVQVGQGVGLGAQGWLGMTERCGW